MPDNFVNTIINLFTPEGFGSVLGFFLIIMEALYLVFALIMVRQVSIKNDSVITPFAPLFTLLAWAHLLAAGLVLLLSWVAL